MVEASLYPFQSLFFDRRGLKLHYLDEGSGEPVVMLHGNPTWSFFYRRLILALRDRYRVIAPDHIGCGLSDKPGDEAYDYTWASRVEDVEVLLESLNLKSNITLILHDWGGAIGLAYALRHLQAVKRIVLLNTSAFRPPQGKPLPWRLKLCRNRFLGPILVQGLNVFCLGAANGAPMKALSPEVREAYLAPYDSWKNRLAVLRFVQDIPMGPADKAYGLLCEVEQGLKRLADLPSLILWGGKDFVFNRDFFREWQRLWPKAETRLFPMAGHYLLEDAGDDVSPLIRDFLAKRP